MLTVSTDVVSTGASSTTMNQAADRVLGYLDSSCFQQSFLDRFAVDRPVDFRKTALVGHSRGGEAARFLANKLNGPRYDVKGVVSMAPTRFVSGGFVGGSRVPALMVLFGSSDADVRPRGVFTTHDVAGNGWNDLSTPSHGDLDRVMKVLVGGTHGGFSDRRDLVLGRTQLDTAMGYINAFLRARLLNDWRFYEDYVRGDRVPGDWAGTVTSQYSDVVLRRVIDNFTDNDAATNHLGGPVWTHRMGQASSVSAAGLSGTAHAGRVLRMRPDERFAYVAWGLPAAFQNGSAYSFLSFRLGRLTGNGPVDVRVWIQNGAQFSWVDLADYGEVPRRVPMCVQSSGLFCVQFRDTGHMRTFRIPLDDFAGRDAIRRVYIQFRGDGVGDTYMLDNLELASSRWVTHPPLPSP